MVESKKSRIGHGLFAQKDFKKGDVITEIHGSIVDEVDDDNSNYIDFGDDETLYPSLPYRHINHSCEPNCEFTLELPESIRGKKALYLEAVKDIKAGEELFTDYAWTAEVAIRCECNSDKCRGWIVDKNQIHLVGEEVELVA